MIFLHVLLPHMFVSPGHSINLFIVGKKKKKRCFPPLPRNTQTIEMAHMHEHWTCASFISLVVQRSAKYKVKSQIMKNVKCRLIWFGNDVWERESEWERERQREGEREGKRETERYVSGFILAAVPWCRKELIWEFLPFLCYSQITQRNTQVKSQFKQLPVIHKGVLVTGDKL